MAAPQSEPAIIQTDAVVIGAGPVGLFQVFQLGLHEIHAHVIDVLPYCGGQCVELYPDKPIYDIPGLPVVSGRDLTERLLQQVRPFKPTFHLGHEVSQLALHRDGASDDDPAQAKRFHLQTANGLHLITKTVFIAAGVGAFLPRKLALDGLTAFEESQVLHHVLHPQDLSGQRLVVLGAGDAALNWACHFAEPGPDQAASVTLVHRRDAFTAEPASIHRMREHVAAGLLRFVAAQPTGFEATSARLTALTVTDADGVEQALPVDTLIVCLGLNPRLGPMADWGLALERKQLVVDTARFETSVPGIYAVGDINTYPGKRKLIVCGFHEATLAAYAAAARVYPDRKLQVQYTTSSPRLHQLLGVADPA